MKFRTMMIAAAALTVAAAGFAQLSMAKADWARGPVQYLMTKEELTQWKAVKSDAEADQFIALFWARRDPTPGTPRNEFREDFENRVQYADTHFNTARDRGSLTDRGKVLILFGAPTQPVRNVRPTTPTQPNVPGTSTSAEDESLNSASPEQVWIYDGEKAQKEFGAPRVEVRFADRISNGDFRMETPRFDFTAAQQRMVTAAITQPNLTSVPTYQQQPQPAPAAAPQAAPAPAAPTTELTTPALQTAAAEAKTKPSNKQAMISYAEFVAPTGDYFVPVELYVPASAGLAADAADTFFGVIQDATGKNVLAFEDPTPLTSSKGDFFVDKTLSLPTGKYTATLGLAKAGTPVVVTAAPIELNALTKDSTGTSRLILSNNIYELQTAAPVKSPFAFGKLKIVPKADLKFTNKDELGYFVEVHNPGITTGPPAIGVETTTTQTGPGTSVSVSKPVALNKVNLPALQMKIELLDSKGKVVAGAPLSEVDALPLSGQVGPGQYAIINSIPLAQMSKPLAPGEYTLKMKIIDTISKQSYNVEQKFTIAA